MGGGWVGGSGFGVGVGVGDGFGVGVGVGDGVSVCVGTMVGDADCLLATAEPPQATSRQAMRIPQKAMVNFLTNRMRWEGPALAREKREYHIGVLLKERERKRNSCAFSRIPYASTYE
jgi:hypothetical protein